MKITWINPTPIVGADDNRTSRRICVRLRSMLPGDELRRRGHDVEQMSVKELLERVRDPLFLRRDVFVFGKAFGDLSPFIRLIRASGEARVLVDICDNVFVPPEDGLKSVYLAMIPLADGIVASSEFLAAELQNKIMSGTKLFSVSDVVEGTRFDPEFAPRSGSIKLLWFGYPNNLPSLQNELKNLKDLTTVADVSLTIVTDMAAVADGSMILHTDMIDGIRTRYCQWSPETMQSELKACDIVIIPSDCGPAQITKSANRVISAIWAGKFVAAHPLPSYLAFQPFAHIGRDLVSGVRWALENQDAARERIASGQKYIQENFTINKIADDWDRVFEFIMNSHPSFSRVGDASSTGFAEVAGSMTETHENLRKFKETVDTCRKALKLDPENVQLLLKIGDAYADNDKIENSLPFYHRALNIDPHSAYAHMRLGYALRKQGKTDEAKGYFQRAVELDPDMANHCLLQIAVESS